MLPASSYHANTGFVIVLVDESIVPSTTSVLPSIHTTPVGTSPFKVISAISSSVAISFMVKVTALRSASRFSQ